MRNNLNTDASSKAKYYVPIVQSLNLRLFAHRPGFIWRPLTHKRNHTGHSAPENRLVVSRPAFALRYGTDVAEWRRIQRIRQATMRGGANFASQSLFRLEKDSKQFDVHTLAKEKASRSPCFDWRRIQSRPVKGKSKGWEKSQSLFWLEKDSKCNGQTYPCNHKPVVVLV